MLFRSPIASQRLSVYQLARGVEAVEGFHPATAVLLRGVINRLSVCVEESAVSRVIASGALKRIVHKTAREYKREKSQARFMEKILLRGKNNATGGQT